MYYVTHQIDRNKRLKEHMLRKRSPKNTVSVEEVTINLNVFAALSMASSALGLGYQLKMSAEHGEDVQNYSNLFNTHRVFRALPS